MKEPSLHNSRLALAGGIAAILLGGIAGFAIGRGTTKRVPPAVGQLPVVAAAPVPTPAAEPAAPIGLFGRSDLVRLAAIAADATAAGRTLGPELGEAAGRRFALRLPFGCGGPAAEGSEAPMRWRYDAEAEALRVSVSPTLWSAGDWWPASPPPGAGAVEGFWVARPWTSSEDCPAGGSTAGATGAEPVTLPGQTLALGQVVPATDPAESARERTAYDTVVRVPQAALDTSRGFRVRISGRIARLAGAGPVHCRQSLGPEQQPICLVGIVMDEIAIENAASGETVATWNVSERGPTAG